MYKKLSDVIASHHERYDGKGYPKGLKGNEISKLSHIMIVADSFDAMTTNRIYKPRMSLENALLELKQFSGTQFHPEVVDIAIEVFSLLEINANIFQLPSTEMESKRFAFFFEDQLTKAYNKAYLELLLVHNKNDIKGKQLDIILIHNFSRYNFEYGWDKGDLFLQELVKTIRHTYPDTLIFRLHGDDFVLFSEIEIELDLSLLNPLPKDAKEIIHVRHKKFNTKEDSLNSLVELDRILKA
jgi:GGDEF domain-containing protein